MIGALDRVAFTLPSGPVRWREVLLAAVLRGSWDAFESTSRLTAELERRAEARGERPGEEALEALAERFRREHRLTTAAEARSWLRAHGLSVDAWLGGLVRREYRALLPHDRGRLRAASVPLQALHADAVCTGQYLAWAMDYRGCLAHAAPVPEPREHAGDPSPLARVVPWLAPVDVALVRHVKGVLREAEVRRGRILQDTGALRDIVDQHRSQWRRIRAWRLDVEDTGVAAEVALAVKAARREGQDAVACLRASARDLESQVEAVELMASALGEEQLGLVRAAAGDVVGPLLTDGTASIYLVQVQVPATLGDPFIAELASEVLLERAVSHV